LAKEQPANTQAIAPKTPRFFFPETSPSYEGLQAQLAGLLGYLCSCSPGVSNTTATSQKPPSLRNNNGSLQVRVRIDGKDAFINRLGRWSDPVAVAKAHAISAQIWSDYQQGTFDYSLMAHNLITGCKKWS
jgi:hypothetical protein